jgi:hypothetical protein
MHHILFYIFLLNCFFLLKFLQMYLYIFIYIYFHSFHISVLLLLYILFFLLFILCNIYSKNLEILHCQSYYNLSHFLNEFSNSFLLYRTFLYIIYLLHIIQCLLFKNLYILSLLCILSILHSNNKMRFIVYFIIPIFILFLT